MNTIDIDYSKSSITWKGFKPGGGHTGTLGIKDGKVDLDDKNVPIGGRFTFDMNAIDDKDQSGMMKAELEKHLKSDEFFDVEKYPLATFSITKIDPNSDNDGFYMVTGNLEIKDITNEISFKAKYTKINDELEIETSTLTLDRTRWKVNFGSTNIFKKLKDHIVADNIEINAQIWIKI